MDMTFDTLALEACELVRKCRRLDIELSYYYATGHLLIDYTSGTLTRRLDGRLWATRSQLAWMLDCSFAVQPGEQPADVSVIYRTATRGGQTGAASASLANEAD